MIEHGDLKRDWPMVRKGLEVICARQQCDFIPEDIYHMIKSGRGSLYVNGERDSFMVLRKITHGRTGEEGAEMVVTFCAVGRDSVELIAEIEEIARAAGCTYLEMDSQRRGFARTGWDEDRIVYRRRL